MDDAKEEFIAKVDAFAATLEPEEQTMFIDLLVGDDGDVSGFAAGWPGLVTLGVMLEDAGIGVMLEDAGIGIIEPVKPHTGFQQTGGGSPKV